MFESILSWVVGIVATIIIILMVVLMIKDVVSYLQGQGTSLMKILGKVGAIILIVAIIFLAKGFVDKGETISSGIGDKAIEGFIDEANKAIP